MKVSPSRVISRRQRSSGSHRDRYGRPALIGRSRTVALTAMVALWTLAMPPTAGHAYPRPGGTERVSVASDGTEGNGNSLEPTISAEGRFVAFWSYASNLVAADTNGRPDIFVRDRETGAFERVSVGSDGAEGNGSSTGSFISSDGSTVAFESNATNLVDGDSDDTIVDAFVHDRATDVTERVSVASDGSEANGPSRRPALSEDGRYVVFYSEASNLVSGDTNGVNDVFVRDRKMGITERVSVTSEGAEADGASYEPTISADGRFIAFESTASNLAPSDRAGTLDVFLHDRETGTTTLASRSGAGSPGSGPSESAAISADGRYVAFSSLASDLVPEDVNNTEDLFVFDRETATTERVSVSSVGAEANDESFLPAISPDGRYVAFYSAASNLAPGDDEQCFSVQCLDVFVHDRNTAVTERVSVDDDGMPGEEQTMPCPSCPPSIGSEGHIAFQSAAINLVSNDANGRQDVFVRDRGPAIGVRGLSVALAGDKIAASGRGTFSGVALASSSDPPGDGGPGAEPAGAELTHARVLYRPEAEDVLVHLGLTSLPNLGAGPTCVSVQCVGRTTAGGGSPGILYGLGFAAGDTRYEARAFRLNSSSPAASHFGLYQCAQVCTEQAQLTGAIGTTGPEVFISVPLSHLELGDGGTLSALSAFTAAGEGTQEARATLDEAPLPDSSIQLERIALGIAPAGTPREEVRFDTDVALNDGAFAGTLDASTLPAGDYDVWASACLGEICGAASRTLAVDVEAPGAAELAFADGSVTSGQYGDVAELRARLTDPSGAPVEGAIVAFTLAGDGSAREFSAVTDHDGIGETKVTLEEKPGPYQLDVRYDGDDLLQGAGAATSFSVTKEDSAMEIVVEGLGTEMTLRSRLSELDSASDGIPGRTIAFYSDGELIGSDETDADGVAAIAVPSGHRGAGHTYKSLFTGDDFYLASRSDLPGLGGSDGPRNRVIPGPLSANGRITTWVSAETDIVPNDTNDEQDIFARDLMTGETMLVSVADDGSQANDGSSGPAPSGDGRYVAFASAATNLVAGDTAPVGGLFVHDLVTGTNERISVASNGEQANKPSFDPVMSHDGRFVVFESAATNLDPRDSNRYPDIFVHDLETRRTKVVSVDSEGNVHDGGALFPDISPDGRYVAFQSYAALVPGDSNGKQDVYVHDTQTGETEIASISTDGVAGNQDSRTASISRDGRFVAFSSYASTLVPQDTNGAADIFVRDRHTDTTRRVTVTSSGAEAQSGGTPFVPGSYFPSLSGNGRYVAYQSDAPNLMPDDTSDWDVFVHDLVTGSTTLGVKGMDGGPPDAGAGTPEMSSDGRHLTFLSGSKNLVSEETDWFAMFVGDRGPTAGIGSLSAELAGNRITAEGWATFSGERLASAIDPADDAGEPGRALGSELTGVTISVRPELADLFVRWELAQLPAARSVAAGAPGVVHAASFEVDGARYELRAARVGAAGRAPSFGLFRCDPACIEIQELQGGYGESGTEITTSVDVGSLGLQEPDVRIRNITAFSGPGEAAVGVVHRLDEVALADVSVPEIEIRTGVAPAGTSPEDVAFTEAASFSDGNFLAELSTEDLAPGEYDVWARGCLGQRCGLAVAPVVIEPRTDTPIGKQLCTATNPVVDKVVAGDVVVPQGETCTLAHSTVEGRIEVLKDASLDAQSNSIEGNVEGAKPESIRLTENDIGGNIEIKGGTADVLIVDNEVAHGDLEVEKITGTVSVSSNHLAGGTIEVTRNLIDGGHGLVVAANVVSEGDLKVEKNRGPGDKSVTDNVGGRNLVCEDNEAPFVGRPNGTWVQKQDQCRE